MPTPLVDWLRAQDDDTLADLLRLRPDLAVPPPADLTVLATRAGIRASVHRACDDLDTVALHVVEALVVADADTAPVAGRRRSRRLLGPDLPRAALDAALAALRARALLGRGRPDSPDCEWAGIALVPAVRDVVSRFPGGLGRPAAGVAASSDLPQLLAAVDPDERRVLETLAAGPPVGRSRGGADPASPVSRLLARGLLVRVDAETVELPRQVGLALRGDRPLGALTLDPPDLATSDRGVETVDGTAAGAALRALRQVEQLVAVLGRPPRRRRCGPAASVCGSCGAWPARSTPTRPPPRCSSRSRWRPTWSGRATASRPSGFRRPGPTSGPPGAPSRSGPCWPAPGSTCRACRGSSAPATTPDGRSPRCPTVRAARRRPATAAGCSPGSPNCRRERPWVGPTRWPACWRGGRRRQGGRLRDEVVRWTLTEATVLGVVALDALSTPGRTLLADPARAAAALRVALPDPVDHVLLQADLTAVAPGPLEPELERELDLVGEVESAGGATVYRFTEATVRRALDAGRTAAELHELFATRSATPVPQGLTYLVDDVARRHGRLRGGAAASFLRSDDEVLIAEVLASPAAGSLELRRIAPTVAVSPLPLAELMDGLREAGFTPAAEDQGGAVLDLTDRGRRISPRRRSGPPRAVEPDPEQLRGLVSRMRAGDALAGLRRSTEVGRACGPRARRRDRRDPSRRRPRAAQRVDRLRRRPRGGGRAGAGADERRRRGRRGPRQRGRRPAPRPAAPDHLDRARRGADGAAPGRAAGATGPRRTSGAASRARPARSGSASPTRGRGRRS